MRCNTVKKILLTDYCDRRVSESDFEEIRRHTENCSSCRALEKNIQKYVISFFKDFPSQEPSEELFLRIKEALFVKEKSTEEKIRKIKSFFSWQRPVFTFTAVFTVILFFLFAFRFFEFKKEVVVNEYLAEQRDFLASLDESRTVILEQTWIDYFL